MKEKSIIIADYFFYSLIFFTLLSTVSIMSTPAKGFLLHEIKKSTDFKGKERAIFSFDKKLEQVGLTRDTFEPELLIRKRRRELIVLSGNTLITSYSVGLGRNPIGIKLNATDGRTPEGNYYICKKNEHHRYRLFLQINYPSPDDAKRGVIQQILLPGAENKIIKSWADNSPPPSDTPLGGEIGIHGYGAESSWTKDGSISMHNAHIEELFWNIKEGTPVAIVP